MVVLGLSFVTSQSLVVDDTEGIADSVGFSTFLGVSDTVAITDSVSAFSNNVTITEGPAGWTYQAVTERGCSYQGGAESGVVL